MEQASQDAAPDWTFGGRWPYPPCPKKHGGVRVHYVDEGTAAYSHAEVHRIETASHFLQEDEPERILEILDDFFERNA